MFKDVKEAFVEAPRSEKFWTSILFILWISLAIYSMAIFILAQLAWVFVIIFIASSLDSSQEENEEYYPVLWVGTSIILIIVFIVGNIGDILSSVCIKPVKRFNKWLNKS